MVYKEKTLIEPIFKSNFIPVFYSSNDAYLKYTYVSIKTLINNSSLEKNYDIVVLYDELEKKETNKFKQLNDKNISIRFYCVHDLILGKSFFTENKQGGIYLSKEAYYRTLIYDIVSEEYKKVIYLDGDTLLMQDIASLYENDISNHLLGAVRDVADNVMVSKDEELRKYRDCTLHLKKYDDYFNSGVLLMNIAQFKKNFEKGYLIEKSASQCWRKHDQDVLNVVSPESTILLPLRWNLIECGDEQKAYMSDEQRSEYFEAMDNPALVHFAARKPWKKKGYFFDVEFWQNVFDTPFSEEILSDYRKANEYLGLELLLKEGKISKKTIIKLLLQRNK